MNSQLYEMGRVCLALLIICLSLLNLMQNVNCVNYRHKVMVDLVGPNSSYRTEVTPVKDSNLPIKVKIKVKLHQIRFLDEPEQLLETIVWLTYEWRDEFLSWNQTEYGNMSLFHVPSTKVWTPDIVLWNSVDDETSPVELMPKTDVRINSNGTVTWPGPAIIKSSCKISIKDFPFDTQRCPLLFGSWAYDVTQIDVIPMFDHVLTGDYVNNSHWLIVDKPCKRRLKTYQCCNQPYPHIECILGLKRMPMFHLYNLLFPVVVILVLGILVFCLSVESIGKVPMCITLLLSMSVYQSIIMNNTPRTSRAVPLLNRYFGAIILLLAVCAVCAVLILNWHYNGKRKVRPARWVRVLVIQYLSVIVFLGGTMKTNTTEKDYTEEEKTNRSTKRNVELVAYKRNTPERSSGHQTDRHTQLLDTTKQILSEMERKEAKQSEKQRTTWEWKFVARVMNRVFLFLYVIAIIVITVVIFMEIP